MGPLQKGTANLLRAGILCPINGAVKGEILRRWRGRTHIRRRCV